MKVVPVILAGGIGERFWPMSRSYKPKQLLPLISDRSMLEETIRRVDAFCKNGVKPLIVTSRSIVAAIRKTLPSSLNYDIIAEPVGKNTAPAVSLAASWLHAHYGECVMAVLSADHAISPKKEYTQALRYAASLAVSQNSLVVFGITPIRPDTGYGYIERSEAVGMGGPGGIESFKVKRFVEKPDGARALAFCKSGTYLWNSGMFVFKTSVILEEFKCYMPDLYDLTQKAAQSKFTQRSITTFYDTVAKESIDYGIMEKSRRVAVVVGRFTWDDVGSWESVGRLRGYNDLHSTISGAAIYETGCKDSIIVNTSSRALMAAGLENVVVVVTDDAVMVLKRDALSDIKKYRQAMIDKPLFDRTLF